MREALAEARRAVGRTHPNPAVGAVVVRDGADRRPRPHRPGGRPPRRGPGHRRRGAPRAGRGPLHHPRAVRSPRPDAAVHRGHPRRRRGAGVRRLLGSEPAGRRAGRPPAARARDAGVDRRARRRDRCAQPALLQGDARGAAVGDAQGRRVARRQAGHRLGRQPLGDRRGGARRGAPAPQRGGRGARRVGDGPSGRPGAHHPAARGRGQGPAPRRARLGATAVASEETVPPRLGRADPPGPRRGAGRGARTGPHGHRVPSSWPCRAGPARSTWSRRCARCSGATCFTCWWRGAPGSLRRSSGRGWRMRWSCTWRPSWWAATGLSWLGPLGVDRMAGARSVRVESVRSLGEDLEVRALLGPA